jgi:hypothetical protein
VAPDRTRRVLGFELGIKNTVAEVVWNPADIRLEIDSTIRLVSAVVLSVHWVDSVAVLFLCGGGSGSTR